MWQRYGVTEAGMVERFAAARRAGETIYVAERANEVLGFIWIVVRGAFNRSGYIQLIGVRPANRHHGVGKALMAFAENQLWTTASDIFLLVSDFNADAQRFYRRLGYQPVGRLDDYVVRGVSELIFWKRRSELRNDDLKIR